MNKVRRYEGSKEMRRNDETETERVRMRKENEDEKDNRRRKMKDYIVKVKQEERKKKIEAKGFKARQIRKCTVFVFAVILLSRTRKV